MVFLDICTIYMVLYILLICIYGEYMYCVLEWNGRAAIMVAGSVKSSEFRVSRLAQNIHQPCLRSLYKLLLEIWAQCLGVHTDSKVPK